jgi:transposase
MKNWNYTIGNDVSRNTLDFHCSEINQHIQVSNDLKGFKDFLKWCKSQGIDLGSCIIILEFTGGYEYRFIQFCETQGIPYSRIPGLAIKRSMGITRGKTDKVDAARIARYGEEKHKSILPSRPFNKNTTRLKELLSFRKRIVRQQAGLKSTLSEREKMYPEIKNDVICKTIQKLIKQNQKVIDELEEELMVLIKSNQALKTNYELLTSIRGIGKINALMTIAYTENFYSFSNPRSYAVYVGVVPFEHSSGTSIRGRKRVSSIANKELKQELNQAARSAMQWDPELQQYAVRKLLNKPYNLVLNNVKFKLILRMFAVVKRQAKFEDNYQKVA